MFVNGEFLGGFDEFSKLHTQDKLGKMFKDAGVSFSVGNVSGPPPWDLKANAGWMKHCWIMFTFGVGAAFAGAYFFGAPGIAAIIPGFFTGKKVFISIKKSKEIINVGDKAIDGPIVSMDGKKSNILSFAKGDRPLVLNFGSYS